MPNPNSTHVDNTGVDIQVTLRDSTTQDLLDLSDAQLIEFLFQKPSGELLTKTGGRLTSGEDGIARYISIVGDFDEVGTWKYQVRVTFDDPDDVKHSDIGSFKVLINLPIPIE